MMNIYPLAGSLVRFNAVEVSPVREFEGCCEVCPEGKEQFWSVYLRYDPNHPDNKGFGGVACIADWPSKALAERYGTFFEEALKIIAEEKQ